MSMNSWATGGAATRGRRGRSCVREAGVGKKLKCPSHDNVVIDYSVAAISLGVMFIEAEYDDSASVVDMRRLAGDNDEHHAEAFSARAEMEVGGLLPATTAIAAPPRPLRPPSAPPCAGYLAAPP